MACAFAHAQAQAATVGSTKSEDGKNAKKNAWLNQYLCNHTNRARDFQSDIESLSGPDHHPVV
jgi:hypothetical protein